MRAALFGGCFDPVHIAHKKIAQKALKNLLLKRVFVVPTLQNPFKKSPLIDADLRIKLLKKVFKHNHNIKVVDYDIRNNNTKTLKTIKFLYKTYKISKLYLIIGIDNLDSFNKWHHHKEILKLAKLVVVPRNRVRVPRNIQTLNITSNASSTHIRSRFEKSFIPKEIREDIKKIMLKRYKK